MSNFFHHIRIMLDAIAYAEAGDLDTVKELLQEQAQEKQAGGRGGHEMDGLAAA